MLNYNEKLAIFNNQDEHKLYNLIAISNLDQSEIELQKSNLKDLDVLKNLIETSSAALKAEFLIKDVDFDENSNYVSYFTLSRLKCTRTVMYFCNLSFNLFDALIKMINSEIFVLFSSYTLTIIENELFAFFEGFVKDLVLVIFIKYVNLIYLLINSYKNKSDYIS